MIFVDFRLVKNIIINKTGNFVERNTSNHACQIFCSKSNCEMYVSLMFPPQDNRGQNNEQSECLLRPQLYPRSRFTLALLTQIYPLSEMSGHSESVLNM